MSAVASLKRCVPSNSVSRGFGLVEIVVGIGIIAAAVFGLGTTGYLFAKTSRENVRIVQAGFLLEEGMELVRAARDGGWEANIAIVPLDTDRFVAVSGGAVTLAETPEIVLGNWLRTVRLSSVYRDANDSIAQSGTSDPDARKVTIIVTWSAGDRALTRTAVGYITDIHAGI